MRVAMVQLVLVKLKSFYPMAGYDLLGKNQSLILYTYSRKCLICSVICLKKTKNNTYKL